MWLTRLSIKRPVFITMVVTALVVLGLRSLHSMKTELNPRVDVPFVTIAAVYPGAGPEEIETLVTEPLEEAVSAVTNVKSITSTSEENLCTILVEFLVGTDLDQAFADVREKVDAARRLLPAEVEPPTIQKFDIGALPVLYLQVSGPLPPRDLRLLVENEIKPRLTKVNGVGAVNIVGGEVREIQINVDKSRLDAYGLSITHLAQAIAFSNLDLPSGQVEEGRRQYRVRVLGQFGSVDEIRNLRLNFNGLRLRLSDLATVEDTVADRNLLSHVRGQEAITLTVQKMSDANTVEVVDGVRAELERLKRELPPGVNIGILQDDSRLVRAALHDITTHLILAIILVVLVVFMFLHNARGMFIISISIPTCLVATFILMYFAGFTLNQMTMLGLTLVIGILVDDSIVVLENIFRHLQIGEGPQEAALNGRSEIGLAAVAITLTDVVVFVPIAFMGGMVGQFFREFGLTVATATLLSLFISFTLTPMLASRWYRRGERIEVTRGLFALFDRAYRALDRRYRNLLAWALQHRAAVVVLGVGSLILVLVVLGPRLGFQFIPPADRGQIAINVEMPPGTRLEVTTQMLDRLERMAAEIPEVKNTFSTAGMITGSPIGGTLRGEQYGQIMVTLIERARPLGWLFRREGPIRHRSDQEIAAELRRKVADLPGVDLKIMTISPFRYAYPIQIELRGREVNELNRVARAIRDRLQTLEGVLDPDISWRLGQPELQVKIDRVRAAEFGLTIGQIARVVRDSLEGNTDSKFRVGNDEFDIRVQLRNFDRRSGEDVRSIIVDSKEGRPIYLRDVATLHRAIGPTSIERKDRERQVIVYANLAPGYPLGNMQVVINRALKEIDLGQVRLHWGGEAEIMRESAEYMFSALGLSIVLVYMLMAALFESFLSPFIIMLSLPMALIGALLGLVIAGHTLSIVSMIGVIMLVGLVTKNAILLIDYTNTLRQRGLERNAAVLEAGPTRLRPILMTTLSMVFGLLPVAIGVGEAAEMRAPMATCVIGGLVVSTLLTLVVIPVVYTIFDDLQGLLSRAWQNLRAARVPLRPAPLPDPPSSAKGRGGGKP